MTDPKRLLISFSGGETSAYMTQWLMANVAHRYDEVLVLFANTGQEAEPTLEFVDRCDRHFDWGVVWLEAVVNPEHGKGVRHKVVNYESADRDGNAFEAVIAKSGIPNPAYLHCTRDLKLGPITSYVRSLGWKHRTYDTAIGIRVDEIDRMDANAKEKRLLYPLVSPHPTSKPEINRFWQDMPFRLELKSYEGNCKWCWKKSLRKHVALIKEHPEWYDFPERMEREHGLSGKNIDGNKRVFFRHNISTIRLREIAATSAIAPPQDDSTVYEVQMGLDLDASYGCSESCEVEW